MALATGPRPGPADALQREHRGGVLDVGQTRALPWKRRPQATALLQQLARPGRGFYAVVISEPQRAFYGAQFGNNFPLFVHYGVPLWVPRWAGRSTRTTRRTT
ncbi:hypothetical protein [Streptomyces inhibens]|uniref:hypothetical protein n=1 Tax=Streptomyces inhibens TaxID=2293571 RepID=UPI001C6DE731|nr:hypothetical protein [Streptomyces inhibens]